LPIFTARQNTEELLEGSMSLALTRVLVNFAHGGLSMKIRLGDLLQQWGRG